MFRNSDRYLLTPDRPGPGVRDVTFNAPTPARMKPSRRSSGWRIPLAGHHSVRCPQCLSVIRDRIAVTAGYCAECQDFTLMCAAGRRLVSPDVMTRTGWHWPCISAGVTKWQVTQRNDPTTVLLCAAHSAELESGLVPWIVKPVFIGQ
jgi:hypothetical protein